jgi:diacylglycerol O-acyltransferase-1
MANFIVFLVSAAGHEYVVSASIGVIEFWAFFGMLLQAPVI